MYFEGTCFMRSLPIKLKEAVLTPDPSLPTPAPLWQQVSSNVGTSNTDDGYVFQSVNARNGHKVVFGIKSEVNGFDAPSYPFEYGYRVFIADKYTPGSSGVNGVFDSYLYERLPVVGYPLSGYTVDNLPLRYWISIKADRVILAVKTDIVNTYARTNIVYFGRPQVYFEPTDVGTVLGTGLASVGTSTGTVRMLRDTVGATTGVLNMTVKGNLSARNKIWGGKVFPSRLFLMGSQGYRGILDLYALSQDGRLRKTENIRIGNTDYFGIELPYADTIWGSWHYNNLSPNSATNVFLFPKD